ncbi:hypothetical protein GOBAR_DD27057 [Gossypium barbadense]|nr:hypothetical protein GOBAR_DD27057 [Gossypium barbadense]
MEAGVEVDEMGWDLSLRAQSRRAQAMSSVWLREEGRPAGRTSRGDEFKGNSEWGKARKLVRIPDPILGFNLEGDEGKKRARGDIEESNETGGRNRRKAKVFKRGWFTVHFDAAFNRQTFISALGMIAWNGEGEILAS